MFGHDILSPQEGYEKNDANETGRLNENVIHFKLTAKWEKIQGPSTFSSSKCSLRHMLKAALPYWEKPLGHTPNMAQP